MNITNDAQLKAAILKELSVALDKAATKIHDQLWDSVFSAIYSKPESDFYERTRQFLHSVIKPKVEIKGLNIEVTVGMDSDVMEPERSEDSIFNRHMDVYGSEYWKGEYIPEALLSWWDTGTSNNKFPSLPQTDYWLDVMGDRGYKENAVYQKAIDVFDNAVEEELKKIGVVIKF